MHDYAYRVKPEKKYPVTGMDFDYAMDAIDKAGPRCGLTITATQMDAVANAALRHAIDAGQVVVPTAEESIALGRRAAAKNFPGWPAKWRECIAGFGPIDGVKEVVQAVKAAVENREARELAVAKAVRDACLSAGLYPGSGMQIASMDLKRIIAGVKS
jgi:hypothetical protein